MTSEEAQFADGRKLAAWFRSQRLPLLKGVPEYENFQRRLTMWESGEDADFYVAERYLNLFGFYSWELPEDVWIEKEMTRRGRRIDHATRAQAVEAMLNGERPSVVARRFNIDRKTATAWKQKAAA